MYVCFVIDYEDGLFFVCLLTGVAMYCFADRYMYCEKCFNELPEDGIDMADDPLNPGL